MELEELQARALELVRDGTLGYDQKVRRLAALATEAIPYPAISDECRDALDKRVICDLYEGHAPYAARYILPDYELALRQGLAFLELDPPQDLDDALAFLQIMYAHVPSVTTYPVYLGDLDDVLERFVPDDLSDDALDAKLRRFWIGIDRMVPDAFAHLDLGPNDSRITRSILRVERSLPGCDFDCVACHNPQTIPGHAPVDGHHPTHRTVGDLLVDIRRAAPFISGITVSGGEATEQSRFLRGLFEAVRADPALAHLTCFVDSNGGCDPALWNDLLSDGLLDAAMIDLKCLDPAVHERMTGRPNDRVLASIRHLARTRRPARGTPAPARRRERRPGAPAPHRRVARHRRPADAPEGGRLPQPRHPPPRPTPGGADPAGAGRRRSDPALDGRLPRDRHRRPVMRCSFTSEHRTGRAITRSAHAFPPTQPVRGGAPPGCDRDEVVA